MTIFTMFECKTLCCQKSLLSMENNNTLRSERKAQRFQTRSESLPQRQGEHKVLHLKKTRIEQLITMMRSPLLSNYGCSINRPSFIHDFSRLTFQYLAISVHTECNKSCKRWVSTSWFFITAIFIAHIDRRNMYYNNITSTVGPRYIRAYCLALGYRYGFGAVAGGGKALF